MRSDKHSDRKLLSSMPLGRSVLGSFGLLLVVLLGVSCGSEEPPEVVVEATPEPTPEPPPPPPPEPGQLYYLVLEETVTAPPGSAWSPLHRSYGPVALETADPDFLRDDQASEEVAGTLADWMAGRFASGADLLLVQWSMAWGESGEAGTSRQWGTCSLPCTLRDGFIVSNARHPADPIEDALALFAARPGAQDVTVSVDDGALVVRNGQVVLLEEGVEDRVSSAKSTWKVGFATPDGAVSGPTTLPIGRRLRVAYQSVAELPIQEVVAPVPGEVRLYPDLSESTSPVPPKVRGVEGLAQFWPWEEASKFEGQFGIRPLPSEEGLTIERVEKQVRWVPTARQAGEGETEFSMYSVSRGSVYVVFKPFPRGALAMGATAGEVEGVATRFRIAGPGDNVTIARAQEVLQAFSRFQAVLPLPEGLPEEVLVYLSPQPVGITSGGAGGAKFSLVVDERRSELNSVARAWAHLLLGANVQARSEQAADWVRWAEARLLDSEDHSLWTSVFASAGDDVLQVWLQRMREPKGAGAPDPEAFLDWTSSKIPVLGRELYNKLPTRQWIVGPGLSSLPMPVDAGAGVAARSSTVPYGAALALKIPEAASTPGATLSLLVTPGDGATAQWSSQIVDSTRWSLARGDREVREKIAAGWDSFVPATGEAVPVVLPGAGPGEAALVAVSLRGQAAWQAQVTLRVELPEAAE